MKQNKLVKEIKTRSYFKRYQTKYRRRREGKTDYYARRKLVIQDKTKYDAPKYRFVVRFSNKDVTCQIVYSRIVGDFILAAAYSHELPTYGIPLGLTNYSATYATGLLCARRLLKKLNIDGLFQGTEEVNGEHYLEEEEVEGKRPFKCYLDSGLGRTTTGAKLFAAMKGAADGGVQIPHSDSRFPGYKPDMEELESEVLRSHIFGGHVADYMRFLMENDPEKYKKQFSKYIEKGIGPDNLEEMYKKAHELIRSDPMKKTKLPVKKKHVVTKKMPLEERRERLKIKKEMIAQMEEQEEE